MLCDEHNTFRPQSKHNNIERDFFYLSTKEAEKHIFAQRIYDLQIIFHLVKVERILKCWLFKIHIFFIEYDEEDIADSNPFIIRDYPPPPPVPAPKPPTRVQENRPTVPVVRKPVGTSNLASERIDNGGAGSVQPVSLFDDSLSAPALTKTGMITDRNILDDSY